MQNWKLRRLRTSLEIASFLLFKLERLEERFEVAFAKALRTVTLNDFDEHRGTILNWRGENLKQITFIITIYKNAKVVNGFQIFINLANAVRQNFVVGFGHTQEFHAIILQLRNGLDDVTRNQRDVLRTGRQIVIKIFFDLTLLLAFRRFVDREFDTPISVRHHFRHKRGIFR